MSLCLINTSVKLKQLFERFGRESDAGDTLGCDRGIKGMTAACIGSQRLNYAYCER